MKTLKQLYKNQIKKNAQILKELNPLSRKIQSLNSKRLWQSEEYVKSIERFKELNSGLSRLDRRHETRYLLLAYATIRNKDLTKVEKNYPQGVDLNYLSRLMTKYQDLLKEGDQNEK